MTVRTLFRFIAHAAAGRTRRAVVDPTAPAVGIAAAVRAMVDADLMEEHPNATLVRGLFTAFRNADLAAIERVVPKNAVWHFPGRQGRLAGVHDGRDAILGFLLSVGELTDGTFHLDLIDVVANDRWAIALFEGHGERNGRTLTNPTCLRMRLEAGQIVELHEFVWDLFDVDQFWS